MYHVTATMVVSTIFLHCRFTCNMCPQQQKDEDLALQKWLLYIAPSYEHHTNVAASEKDSPLLECSPCKSAYWGMFIRFFKINFACTCSNATNYSVDFCGDPIYNIDIYLRIFHWGRTGKQGYQGLLAHGGKLTLSYHQLQLVVLLCLLGIFLKYLQLSESGRELNSLEFFYVEIFSMEKKNLRGGGFWITWTIRRLS